MVLSVFFSCHFLYHGTINQSRVLFRIEGLSQQGFARANNNLSLVDLPL